MIISEIINEVVKPEHIVLLNRMRSEGDAEAKKLAQKIQSQLQKSNISWDVAAELARNQISAERTAAANKQKARQQRVQDRTDARGSGGWDDSTHGHLRTGQQAATKSMTGKERNFSTSFAPKRRTAGIGKQVKQAVKDKYAQVVTDPIDDFADDKTVSLLKRTPAKIARGVGDTIKTAYTGKN